MNNKEDFKNKFEKNNSENAKAEENILSDIKKFQASQEKLPSLISQWLKDLPIEIKTQEIVVNDESVGTFSPYKILKMELINKNKKIIFEPDCLYYIGQTGGVNISSQGVSPPIKALLLMNSRFAKDIPDDSLVLVSKFGSTVTRKAFTEDAFFELINPFS